MGLPRGLLLMLGFCMVEVHSYDADDITDPSTIYHCQYMDNLYRAVGEAAHLGASSCVQSQLTDASRYTLDRVFYSYRKNTSDGTLGSPVYNNVFKLNYHWLCEYFAVSIMIHNISTKTPLIEKETVKKILDDFHVTNGSLVPSDGTFGDPDAYIFTIYDILINAHSQTELLKVFSEKSDVYLKDPFLESEGQARVWPGTTYFGCAILIKDDRKQSDSENLSRLICIFATQVDADREFRQGKIDTISCANAKPPGVKFLHLVDGDRTLCFDEKVMTNPSVAWNNVPCQFFYDVREEHLNVLRELCSPAPDIYKNPGFWDPPSVNFLKLGIYSYGHNISISLPIGGFNRTTTTTTTQMPDGALKLHSIQIYLIVFIALMSSTFSQFFSNYT